MTDITDRDRLDFLAANTEFEPGSHDENEGESLSHWSLRTAAIFMAPKGYAPADLRSAIDRAIAAENILETRRRKQEGVVAEIKRHKQEMGGLPIFRLTPPPGIEYTKWITAFSSFLFGLMAAVWECTQDGRPDMLVIAPDLWPVVGAQDGYEPEDDPVKFQNVRTKRGGRLTHLGISVIVDANMTPGTGELICTQNSGPEYSQCFQTYTEEDL